MAPVLSLLVHSAANSLRRRAPIAAAAAHGSLHEGLAVLAASVVAYSTNGVKAYQPTGQTVSPALCAGV